MHGRRGTGVERRKRGHSRYQSPACYILFVLSSLMLYVDLFFFLLLIFTSSGYCLALSHPLSHSCRIRRLGSASPSSFLLLHTLSGPAGSWPDASSGELKVTHGCSGTDDWLCHQALFLRAPVGPLHFSPLQPGCKHHPLEPFVVSV